jgi:hypothetical protein
MMHTSYFANLRHIASPVSISRWPPKWYKGPQYPLLAPTPAILRDYRDGRIDEVGYTEAFLRDVLGPLDPAQVQGDLVSRFGPDATLLCYENPADFCHRHIVSWWFENYLGIAVTELPRPAPGR